MKRYFAGDTCIIFELGQRIDPLINEQVLYLYGSFKNNDLSFTGVSDIVPSYKSLAFHFDPFYENIESSAADIEKEINRLLSLYDRNSVKSTGNKIVIPVVYNGEDLERISEITNISVKKIIEIHSSVEYRIAMIGFKPYFPYLLGLDPQLAVPRLESPRKLVPAGSVAIGGEQTGIYPEDSPGGWNIIGRCRVEILKEINPGDIIIFNEVGKI
jgi:KipI family sensor histidine kinase inhibitor